VALEGQVRRLELERGAQLEQGAGLLARELRDGRAAVGLDDDEALGRERAERGAQRVPGDPVGRRQLLLAQPLPAGEVAVEDAGAERLGDGVDGGDAAEASARSCTRRGRDEPARRAVRERPG
jgi:hypothetical protein